MKNTSKLPARQTSENAPVFAAVVVVGDAVDHPPVWLEDVEYDRHMQCSPASDPASHA